MANISSGKTNYRNWLAKAVIVLVAVSLTGAIFTTWLLYEAAFEREKVHLTELVRTQAILIEAVANFDVLHNMHDHPDGVAVATFSKLEAAHREYPDFGKTGEFTLGTLKEGQINFLLSHRHYDFAKPIPIPWASNLGEPMRRALRGDSGVMVGLDYRGQTVLAAHEPLRQLRAGIVSKIDLWEIREPFVRAALIGAAGSLMMVLLGALVFRRISVPLLEREKALSDLSLLSQAVDQSPNMIFITDIKGTIQYVNPYFTQMTGFSLDEAIGQNARILNSGETPREVYRALWDNLLAGREWRGEIKDKRKDGSTFWASMVAAPVSVDDGQTKHFIAIHDDITERKLAAERTRQAREQAEIANRAKSELMANMSHELRTPLNAIIGFSEAMGANIFGPIGNNKYEEYIQYIHASGTHLLEVINDILDVAAVEAGKLVLHEDIVSVPDVVDAALRIILPRADENHITLSGLPDQALPCLRADPRRLKQIYLNLLSNAVKFTPDGGKVFCEAFVQDDGAMLLTVTDTGVGMSIEGIAKAMTHFGQVDSSLARKHEGTGLGLPLTQGLVELHGGTLSIESEVGKGTCVKVVLPAERVIEVGLLP